MSIFDHDRSAERIPVTVLTGFLGSGKTTLLNHLLRHADLADTAVIINEFGEVGIDHLLVERVDGELVLLQSGCVCCTVRSDLEEAIRKLLAARDASRIPPFSRVLIETTGLADPAPIMQMLMANPLIAHFCALNGVVTTVDVPYGARHIAELIEARKQVLLADRVVLTKLDLAPNQLNEVQQVIRMLNPAALITTAEYGVVDANAVIGNGRGMERIVDELDGHALHTHTHGVESMVFCADEPLEWLAVQSWFAAIRQESGADLLRVKGILNLIDEPQPVVVHGVHHVFHQPVRLARWPSADRRSRVVMIVRNLDVAKLRQSFEESVLKRA